MSAARFRLLSPEPLTEHLRKGPLYEALSGLTRLASGDLTVEAVPFGQSDYKQAVHGGLQWPIRYRGQQMGALFCTNAREDGVAEDTARAMVSCIEHALGREIAITDLADALMTGYEELNLLYTLLPAIATKGQPADIGDVLVAETARTLNCRRVSLLALDENRENYQVIASHGLPAELSGVAIPIADSVAAHALWDEDLLVVNEVSKRPDLSRLSRGEYETDAFAVVRVPLEARGEALGFLTVTERTGHAEFTARDRKLLEGLSAMGASALLNCQLHEAVSKQMLSTIHALASAVDAKDHYTHDHAGRVAQLCVATARQLGVTSASQCREVELAGLLHDIGKIGIPDAILTKPSRLSREEYEIIRTHTDIGARIVEHVPGLEEVAKAILHHHERHDGLGYPRGLCGDAIPLASKLIAVADTFDTLTSDRPYHKGGATETALKELERCNGTQFDPQVIKAFAEVVVQDQEQTPSPLQTALSL
ncbi:MAG: HD domain-containing protein [Phycisphaerales bacterium]|nr:MAG: HD domain-containing protein [Phycisphaerales bacterium]